MLSFAGELAGFRASRPASDLLAANRVARKSCTYVERHKHVLRDFFELSFNLILRVIHTRENGGID